MSDSTTGTESEWRRSDTMQLALSLIVAFSWPSYYADKLMLFSLLLQTEIMFDRHPVYPCASVELLRLRSTGNRIVW